MATTERESDPSGKGQPMILKLRPPPTRIQMMAQRWMAVLPKEIAVMQARWEINGAIARALAAGACQPEIADVLKLSKAAISARSRSARTEISPIEKYLAGRDHLGI